MKPRSATLRTFRGTFGALIACASASVLTGALLAAEPAQDQTASPQTPSTTTSAQTNSPAAQPPANAPQQPGAAPAHKEVVPAVPKPKAGSTPSTAAADKDKSKDAAQGTESKEATQAATRGAAGDKPADEDADPAPKKGAATAADKAGSPQRFVPSEQVRADFDVSFPIDI
jgi:hypothetical protein